MTTITVRVRRLRRCADDPFQDTLFYKEDTITMDASKTAAIVSDMWAEHWCTGATKRVKELAPKMNLVLSKLRSMGVRIIFCPSGTDEVYKDYPQRKEMEKYSTVWSRSAAQVALFTQNLIPDITTRIDPDRVQCDCGLERKCNSSQKPWRKKGQIPDLVIEKDDLIGMDENNVINYLRVEKYRHVFVLGVHANMCVIYRKFGLKMLKMSGLSPILVRDMTDCMIPREEPPYQDHFTALDDTIRFIEEQICPSTLSSEITQDPPFVFPEDKRFCKSNNWGDATCGTIFDDNDLYWNRRLLDPLKIRLWVAPRPAENPGIYGIEVDYFQEDIPAHGSTEGSERVIPIPTGNYVTKIIAKHGKHKKLADPQSFIFYISFYGKPGEDREDAYLGEVMAGNPDDFFDVTEVTLEAPAHYRATCLAGVFSPCGRLNWIAFHAQPCRMFDVTLNGKTTQTDTLDYRIKDTLWHTFFLNGCWRDYNDPAEMGLVFDVWYHLNEEGEFVGDPISKMAVEREKDGTKKLIARKAVKCLFQKDETMEVRMGFENY